MARPDDVDAMLVYADWLMDRDDARGEFISLAIAAERDARKRSAFDEAQAEFLASLCCERDATFTSKHGFVDTATITTEDPTLIARLFDEPAMLPVREITFKKPDHAPESEEQNSLSEAQQLVRALTWKTDEIARTPTHISDLTLLTHFRNLQVLQVCDQAISDFTALRSFDRLRALNVANSAFCDINLLVDLPELRVLGLRKTKVTDISALRHMVKLQSLNLNGNELADQTTLSVLASLEHLNVADVGLDDADLIAFRNMTQLTSLNVMLNPIGSVAPLGELTPLTQLYISERNGNDDLTPLARLPHLRYLEAHGWPSHAIEALTSRRSQLWPQAPQLVEVSEREWTSERAERFQEWLSRAQTPHERFLRIAE